MKRYRPTEKIVDIYVSIHGGPRQSPMDSEEMTGYSLCSEVLILMDKTSLEKINILLEILDIKCIDLNVVNF